MFDKLVVASYLQVMSNNNNNSDNDNRNFKRTINTKAVTKARGAASYYNVGKTKQFAVGIAEIVD